MTNTLKKKKRTNLIILAGLGIAIFVVILLPLFILDKLADEDRDYKLMDEMHKLAKELKDYKKQNGKYPESISKIRRSDLLCITYFYPKCSMVHYKLSSELQDFRMAMYSFSWPILFYHPEISMTPEELNNLSQAEQDIRTKKYGQICFFCMAAPKDKKDILTKDSSIPVYRGDKKVFANPEEWPTL